MNNHEEYKWLSELPKLKPCPACGGELEYYDHDFVGCTEKNCAFTTEPDSDNETYALRASGEGEK